MHAPVIAVFTAALALATPALAHANPLPAPAAGTSTATHASATPTDYRFHTVFANTNGGSISLAGFRAALRNGQRYVSHLDTAKHVMTLRLLALGAAAPDSFAPTDRQHLTFQWIERNGRHYSVAFHAANGARIDQRAFVAHAKQGQRYTRVLNARSGAAILTLLPLGATAAHSLPTARWAATRAPHTTG